MKTKPSTRQGAAQEDDEQGERPPAVFPPIDDIVAHLNLALIEVAEPHILDMLRADRRLGPLIEGTLTPTVALARNDNAEAVVRHLRRLGFFPHVILPPEGR